MPQNCLVIEYLKKFISTRRFGRPTAALLLTPAEGWGPFGPCWGLRPPLPPPPQKKSKKNQKIQDSRHGPKMAASNRYGSN